MRSVEPSPAVRMAPPSLRRAFEAAQEAFLGDQTEANWTLVLAAITACMDHDQRRRGLTRPAA